MERSVWNNFAALVLRIIAIITFAGGILLGFVIGAQDLRYYYSFNYFALIIYGTAGIVSGSLFFGLSEIVRLLQAILEQGTIKKETEGLNQNE